MHPRHGGNIKNWYKLYTSIHYNLSHRQMQDGRRGNSANRGKTVLAFMASSFIWTIRGGVGGRCRSQPFATKERYGCGAAACRYTSALAEVSDSPEISVKSSLFCGRTESSAPTGSARGHCRGRRLCRPFEQFQICHRLPKNWCIPPGRCDARRLVSRRSRALRGS